MSKVKHPIKKKRLAYERDHYNESYKSWRKTKPLLKAKARRALRKTANDLTRIVAAEEAPPASAMRRLGAVAQVEVRDRGVVSLKAFVGSRLARRAASVGARKKRRALGAAWQMLNARKAPATKAPKNRVRKSASKKTPVQDRRAAAREGLRVTLAPAAKSHASAPAGTLTHSEMRAGNCLP